MKMFLLSKILRPSCHKCAFKGDGHLADITLADFWGKNIKLVPQFNDNKGCSLILIRTQKGEGILNLAKAQITCAPVPVDKALKGKQCISKVHHLSCAPKIWANTFPPCPLKNSSKNTAGLFKTNLL